MWQKLDAWLEQIPPRAMAALFLLPLPYGVLHQLVRHKRWFTDYKATACAGNAVLQHQPIYLAQPYLPIPGCPLHFATAYVYTPVWADILAGVQHFIGLGGEAALYSLLYVGVLLSVINLLLRAPDLASRVPFLAVLASTSSVCAGNLSGLLHGIILLAALGFASSPAILLLPIVLASIIKPTFGVYAALFLFGSGAWVRRLALCCACVALCAVYFIGFKLLQPDAFALWLNTVHYWGLQIEHGHGFLDLAGLAGLHNTITIGAAYLLYAAVVLLCGLAVAKASLFDERQRLMLGISVCVLLYLRLMQYDEFTMPLGLGLLAAAGGPLTRRLCIATGLAAIACGGLLGGQILYLGCLGLLLASGLAAMRRLRRPAALPDLGIVDA